MAQSTKTLKTGNKDAAKPGKAVTFIVTQESFDVAFKAGCAYAGAYHAAAEALQPILAPLSGLTTQESVNQWRELQRAFTLGMSDARAIDPDSARKAFNRLTDYLGLAKPQTVAAAAKQARRKDAKPDSKSDPVPADGAAIAQAVVMELSAMEAHIVAMVRAGKFEMACEAIAGLADTE